MFHSFCQSPVQNWPSIVLDQHRHLGLEPEEVFSALAAQGLRDLLGSGSPFSRAGRNFNPQQRSSSASGTTVSVDKERFQANLDVQQFKPEEISVKVTGDNTVTVEARHEEKRDEHGFISRQFVRRYVLPEGHDINRVESRLSSDGVLTVTAPKVDSQSEENQRSIPITRTGQPSTASVVENKEDKEEKDNEPREKQEEQME